MRFTMTQLAFLFACLFQSTHLFATTPISASMEANAFAQIFNVAIDGETDTDQWGTLLSPLSVSASAVALNQSNEPGISVGGSGTATWYSADKGSVVFTDYGWTFNNASGFANLVSSNPSWAIQIHSY